MPPFSDRAALIAVLLLTLRTHHAPSRARELAVSSLHAQAAQLYGPMFIQTALIMSFIMESLEEFRELVDLPYFREQAQRLMETAEAAEREHLTDFSHIAPHAKQVAAELAQSVEPKGAPRTREISVEDAITTAE